MDSNIIYDSSTHLYFMFSFDERLLKWVSDCNREVMFNGFRKRSY